MKFRGTPNLYVRLSNKYVQRVTGKKGFHFNDEGEFETENELLIKLLKQHFEEVVEEVEPKEPQDTEATDEVTEEEIEEIATEEKVLHCKKCDFTTNNAGVLMQHYKTEHPKDKEAS